MKNIVFVFEVFVLFLERLNVEKGKLNLKYRLICSEF